MKIYVASSWRNQQQPDIVARLRRLGHDVYDFKNPPTRAGFSWAEIDPNWKQWTPEQYRVALEHPLAQAGFNSDMTALQDADACVLVLPCGASAHLEMGYAIGQGKKCVILLNNPLTEPELMYYMSTSIVSSVEELEDQFTYGKSKVFTNDEEWVIATDKEDLRAVLEEQGVTNPDTSLWTECDPKETWVYEDGEYSVSNTFEELAVLVGRGYLGCSKSL